MAYFLLTFLAIALAILGMAVGSLIRKQPLASGCHRAGMALGTGIGCGICGVEGSDGAPHEVGPEVREFP
jgi:hypothetical protein